MDSTLTQLSGIPTLAPGTGSHVPQNMLHIVNLYSATNEDQELSILDTQDKTVPFTYPLSLKKTQMAWMQQQSQPYLMKVP